MRTEQLTKCFEPLQKLWVRLGSLKTGLNTPVVFYITDRSMAALLVCFSLFACFGFPKLSLPSESLDCISYV